uniref:PPM-type phosphatase domain-containing protein n=1 Tax=Knipowitschia caucasica TaxID=637954 RepID=A0AAV2M2Z5_KNICA
MVLLLWTQSKDGIVALADGRMDSPGHSATMQAAETSSWTFGEIVLNRRWLKDVEKFLTFRTTSQLESFQNHILIISSRWNRD